MDVNPVDTLFAGVVAFVSPDSEYNGQARAQIEKLLAVHSALIVRNINKKVTHFVCSDTTESGQLTDEAKKNGLTLIDFNYFVQSANANALKKEKAYLIDEHELLTRQKSAKRKRAEYEAGEGEEEDEETSKPAKKAKIGAPPKSGTITVVKKGSVPIDIHCTESFRDKSHVYEFKGAWSCMLNQTDIKNNANKFYTIQLIESDDKKKYWVWTRWGRVGNDGQKKAIPCSTLQAAQAEFKKKFTDKTNRGEFKAVKGSYTIIDIDYGDEPEEDEDDKKKDDLLAIPTTLTEPVANLIKLLCDVNTMKKSIISMNIDIKRAPLGKITKVTLDRASKILAKIEDIVSGGKKAKESTGNSDDEDEDEEEEKIVITPQIREKLVDLSNRFYTLVPHYFGMKVPPPLSSYKVVKKKQQMLEELGYIQIATEVLADAKSSIQENPLDTQYKALCTKISLVEKSSEIYQHIVNYVKNTHASTHDQYTLKVKAVYELERDGEEEKFLEKSKDIDNHMLLWHGSRITNFVGILSKGLRIAPPEAPKTGYMFGKGVYFSDTCSKSANYCHALPDAPDGCALLCQVALGTMCEEKAAKYMDKPPKGCQSTWGIGAAVPDPDECVDDPNPVTGTTCKIPVGHLKKIPDYSDSTLLYNEFIVYDVEQVKIRYLVHFKFNFV